MKIAVSEYNSAYASMSALRECASMDFAEREIYAEALHIQTVDSDSFHIYVAVWKSNDPDAMTPSEAKDGLRELIEAYRVDSAAELRGLFVELMERFLDDHIDLTA